MNKELIEQGVKLLLQGIGEDATREGLVDTPARVAKAFINEFCSGYNVDPKQYLSTTFTEVESYNSIVLLKGIDFSSYCEHHLVPIQGVAHIAYLPSKRVVGISKLARVLEGYARRLQIQERLTEQVRLALDEVLNPRGAAVIIKAKHLCISTRGANKPNSEMITSSLSGVFRDESSARAELFSLIG